MYIYIYMINYYVYICVYKAHLFFLVCPQTIPVLSSDTSNHFESTSRLEVFEGTTPRSKPMVVPVFKTVLTRAGRAIPNKFVLFLGVPIR